MNIEGKNILVTGGAGFIGSHVVDALLEKNVGSILIVDDLSRGTRGNLEASLRDPRVTLVETDIRNEKTLYSYFKGIDGCFHLAGLRITQCAAEPRLGLEIMVDGTFNVLDACRQYDVKKVIFSSTASIYGMANTFPTKENHHPWNNQTWYGATKVCCEGLLRSFKDMYGLDYMALRYFNVYGPRMDTAGKYTEVFIRWLDCLAKGEKPKIFGDGKQTMDFVYVGEVARANILAMESDVSDEVVNIASGKETSLAQLLQGIMDAYGSSAITPEHLEERKVNPVPRRLASVQKARDLIGFESGVELSQGLEKLLEWYQGAKV